MANLVDSRSWWGVRQGAAERTRYGSFGAPAAPPPPYDKSEGQYLANWGAPFTLTSPAIISLRSSYRSVFRLLSPGPHGCNEAEFGTGYQPENSCRLMQTVDWGRVGRIGTAYGIPGKGVTVASQGGAFRVDRPTTIWYGGPVSTQRTVWGAVKQNWVGTNVLAGSFPCDDANFGPVTAVSKSCIAVPYEGGPEDTTPITVIQARAHEEDLEQQAQVAAQAQRDMIAAQDRVFAERQAASAAEEQAMIAENALAQAAAALSAAAAYRMVQEEARARAAAYAAEIAALAAANAADYDAAMAAAETAAEAEGVRQALAQARAHEAEQQAAYDMANAATQVEMRRQEQAHARLDAAQNAADQAAANAAAGGMAGSAMSSDLLLYGGLAALAAVLILSDKG